jgi:rhodanese-related sulfurtransferase
MNDILFKLPSSKNSTLLRSQIEHYESKLAYEIDPADLHEALKNNGNVIVIDARSAQGYDLEHIPGAINIPHRTMNKETTRHLNKNMMYITYCDGIGCNASTKGALKMAQLGFTVKELIGGLAWWKADGFSTEGANAEHDERITCYC